MDHRKRLTFIFSAFALLMMSSPNLFNSTQKWEAASNSPEAPCNSCETKTTEVVPEKVLKTIDETKQAITQTQKKPEDVYRDVLTTENQCRVRSDQRRSRSREYRSKTLECVGKELIRRMKRCSEINEDLESSEGESIKDLCIRTTRDFYLRVTRPILVSALQGDRNGDTYESALETFGDILDNVPEIDLFVRRIHADLNHIALQTSVHQSRRIYQEIIQQGGTREQATVLAYQYLLWDSNPYNSNSTGSVVWSSIVTDLDWFSWSEMNALEKLKIRNVETFYRNPMIQQLSKSIRTPEDPLQFPEFLNLKGLPTLNGQLGWSSGLGMLQPSQSGLSTDLSLLLQNLDNSTKNNKTGQGGLNQNQSTQNSLVEQSPIFNAPLIPTHNWVGSIPHAPGQLTLPLQLPGRFGTPGRFATTP